MTHLSQAVKISASNYAIIHTSDVIVSWDPLWDFQTERSKSIQNPIWIIIAAKSSALFWSFKIIINSVITFLASLS